MEGHAVDFARLRIHSRGHGHPPILSSEANPARCRPTAGHNGIQHGEGARRKIDEALTCGHADGFPAERSDERRVAVDDDMSRSSAHAGRTSARRTAAPSGDRGGAIWLHAVDCAPSGQARTTVIVDP